MAPRAFSWEVLLGNGRLASVLEVEGEGRRIVKT